MPHLQASAASQAARSDAPSLPTAGSCTGLSGRGVARWQFTSIATACARGRLVHDVLQLLLVRAREQGLLGALLHGGELVAQNHVAIGATGARLECHREFLERVGLPPLRRERQPKVAMHLGTAARETQRFPIRDDAVAVRAVGELEIAEFREYQRLGRELVEVSEKICRLRPVEESALSGQEKKRRTPSSRKSRAK